MAWWVLLLTKSLYCYNWDNANSGVSIIKLRDKSANFVHFIHHEFCIFHRSPKFCTWLAEQFPTFHPSLHESVTQILSQLRKNIRNDNYSYHPVTQKVYINLVKNFRLDLNNPDFGYCLGYHPDDVLSAPKHHTSQNFPKLDLHHTCYIYTDIVQNKLKGDVKTPLLRVVPVKEGNLTYVRYDRTQFLLINWSNIAVVKVNIRDERGDLLSFQSAASIITLLFWRKPACFFPQ